jgi:outer membrane receptor for ferrienterochelin and colicins
MMSEQLEPQKRMFRAPDSYGYFVSNVNLSHHFKVSLFGNYTGTMLVQHTWEDRDMETMTPDFFDLGMQCSYHSHLGAATKMELNGGVKNIFDSFQQDLDYGQTKDATYVYGPATPRQIFLSLKLSL